MEGPTPVSALIHAATMVTAGVFLIIRTSFIFEFSEICLTILVYLGSLTAVLFGLVGFFQYDIKKIIAFSTCSQLGYMILACGLSGYNLAFFHLFTHAGFKALLFLSAGTFIHMMGNEQDIRKMSGAFNISYLNCICFIIGSLTLFGFPFLSGYFSKEPIIQLAFLYKENPVIFFFIEFSTLLTILYSLKIFYYLFFKKNFNNRKFSLNNNFNWYNFSPLLFLSFISIFSGYFFKDMFIGLGNNFFFGSIFSLSSDLLEIEFIFFFIKIIPMFLIIFAGFLFYEFYILQFRLNNHLYFFNYNCFLFFNRVMFIDSIINLFFGFLFNLKSYNIFFLFDKGVLEEFGPYGVKVFIIKVNNFFDKTFVSNFTKLMVVSIYILLLIIISNLILMFI
jgi:NADH-ubiquinone oxidoreductase chain 5